MQKWWPVTICAVLLVSQAGMAMPPAGSTFAKVIDVAPVYEQVQSMLPQRYCWKLHNAANTNMRQAPTRRCVTAENASVRKEHIGYRVKYRYRGRVGQAHTAQHPGAYIRVRHGLRPIHF